MKNKNNEMVIENNILIDGSKCKGNIIIPDYVKRISGYAFENNKEIITVIIPETVEIINRNAFKNCINLERVIFEDYSGIKCISYNTFENCEKLKKIKDIPIYCPERGKFIGYKKCKKYGHIYI